MKFWDTSAILPLLVHERGSVPVATVLEDDSQMLVWWGSPVEAVSALARREREGSIPASTVTQVLRALDRLSQSWEEITPSDRIRTVAARLLRTHVLRAADSLQLAAAIVAADGQPAALDFVCLDSRLNDCARREGFPVIFDSTT